MRIKTENWLLWSDRIIISFKKDGNKSIISDMRKGKGSTYEADLSIITGILKIDKKRFINGSKYDMWAKSIDS